MLDNVLGDYLGRLELADLGLAGWASRASRTVGWWPGAWSAVGAGWPANSFAHDPENSIGRGGTAAA